MLALATTGIGGLPHSWEDAQRVSFAHQVPFCPTPPEEQMVRAAADGLPGLRADGTVNAEEWAEGRDRLALELLQSPEALVSAGARRFFAEVARRRPEVAKVQLAGPLTVVSQVGCRGEIADQLRELLRVKASALVDGVRAAGATPLIFIDEPALMGDLAPLGSLLSALKDRGATVGVHCCGQAEWGQVLALPIDVLSFDARLSVDAIAEEAALPAFLARGGRLSIGVIPTSPGARYSVPELVDSVVLALGVEALRTALLTPACGLGLRSVVDADRVLSELVLARRLFTEALEG